MTNPSWRPLAPPPPISDMQPANRASEPAEPPLPHRHSAPDTASSSPTATTTTTHHWAETDRAADKAADKAADNARESEMVDAEAGVSVCAALPWLSEEDVILLQLLADGLTQPAIARRMKVSARTVRRRVPVLRDAIGVRNPAEAIVWAAQHGLLRTVSGSLVDPPPPRHLSTPPGDNTCNREPRTAVTRHAAVPSPVPFLRIPSLSQTTKRKHMPTQPKTAAPRVGEDSTFLPPPALTPAGLPTTSGAPPPANSTAHGQYTDPSTKLGIDRTIYFFGEPWEPLSLSDAARPVRTPTGRACVDCIQRVRVGDRGYLVAALTLDGRVSATLEPIHRECDLLVAYEKLTAADSALGATLTRDTMDRTDGGKTMDGGEGRGGEGRAAARVGLNWSPSTALGSVLNGGSTVRVIIPVPGAGRRQRALALVAAVNVSRSSRGLEPW